MTNLISRVLFLILTNGVFGIQTDEVKMVSVMEGDSVTLSTCLNDAQKYKIDWTFEIGAEKDLIAKFNKGVPTYLPDSDGRFRDRLTMDSQTGSLSIRNIRTNHSGVYEVDMTGTSGSSKKIFDVTVNGVFDPGAYNIQGVTLKEGEKASLNTDVKLQKDHLIWWMFVKASKNCVYNPLHHVPCLGHTTPIARIDGEMLKPSFDAGDYEMFKERLGMDEPTGSLTIKNIKPEHSGFYLLQITNNTAIRYRTFNVTVSAAPQFNWLDFWMPFAIVLLVLLVVLLVVFLVVLVIFIKCPNAFAEKCPIICCNCCQSKSPQRGKSPTTGDERKNLKTSHDEQQEYSMEESKS